MQMEDLDFMAFYMQRIMEHSEETPEDVLRLIEQLSNVEEKVKAMEELLGGVRHKNVNVLSVKENYYDDGPSSADPTRTKMKRKRRKRCLCIPWSCSPELSEPFQNNNFVKRDSKNRGGKKWSTEMGGENQTDARHLVSWDEDITVRYIGSSEEVIGKSSKNKENQVNRYRSDKEPPDESPNRESVKDVVHVKIRIPKQKKQSSNVIEITGKNIEDYEKAEQLDKVVKSAVMLKVEKNDGIQEDRAPEENTLATDEDYASVLNSFTSKSSNTIQGKTVKNVITKVRTMNVLNTNAAAENGIERDVFSMPQKSSEMSKSEPKRTSKPNAISEPIISSEHRVIALDSRQLSGFSSRTTETKVTSDSRWSSMFKNAKSQIGDREDLKSSKEYVDDGVEIDPITMVGRPDRAIGRTIETKITPDSRRSSMSNNDKTQMEDQENPKPSKKYDDDEVDPISMIGRSGRISEYSTVGIPVKEPGRRTCGSQGCKCRGSSKNDNNFYELRESLRSNGSNLLLLDEAVEKPAGPEEIIVDTDSGTVNVVTHHSNCVCYICQTFGSRVDSSHRSSIRSDTGARVSKRVIRVRYNDDFRNILTHTEECGCDICIGIDEEIFKGRFLRSTQISTRDSTLLVQNKGICGCIDCKTVTTIHRPSRDVEDLKNDIGEIDNGMETMVSRTSYRSVDPCYYSDATIPSINSFPLKNAITYQKPEITSPSTESLDASEETATRPNKVRNYKDLIVSPAVKHVTLKRNQYDTDNSLIIISRKNANEHGEGSNGSYSNKWSGTCNNRGRSYRNKNSCYVEQGPDEEHSEMKKYQYGNSDSKQEKIRYHISMINKKSKRRRHKAREDRMVNKQREKKENSHENEPHTNFQKPGTSVVRSKKVARVHRSINNRSYDRLAQQTTLEDIIKDLVSGQTEGGGDQTYTVTLGQIHDNPYTKVKIIDCSKRIECDNSSASFDSTQQSPQSTQESSNSTVLFLKPIPSISVSPTCSSNFAKSEGTSVMNVSHPIVTDNHCRVSTPERSSRSQTTSPSPSLFIISPVGDCRWADRGDNLMEDENRIMVANKKIEHRSQCDVHSLPSKYRKRIKHSKFTIKLSRKLCSFFKRNDKKSMTFDSTSVNSSTINSS